MRLHPIPSVEPAAIALKASRSHVRYPQSLRVGSYGALCLRLLSLLRFHVLGLPFPLRGPLGWFPRFFGTMGCCESPTFVPPRFVSFAWWYHTCALIHSSQGVRVLLSGLGLLYRVPCRKWVVEMFGPPRFLSDPSVPMPCSWTPAGPRRLALRRLDAVPVDRTSRTPTYMRFRGSLARPQDSLSTLRSVSCLTATQDSLPVAGCALPGGIRPAGFGLKGFCFLLPPFPGLPWRDRYSQKSAGKEVVGVPQTTTSPSSQWGYLPIFTGVRLSRAGRPHRPCPFRGAA